MSLVYDRNGLGAEGPDDNGPLPRVGPGQLEIESHSRPASYCISLIGELDGRGCSAVDLELERCRAAGATRIVIDLTEVDFIDSSGIALLLAAMRDAQKASHQLRMVPSRSEDVQRLVELCGLRDAMPFTR